MVFKKVTVVGGGFMGAGIAQVSVLIFLNASTKLSNKFAKLTASSGYDVVVLEVSKKAARKSQQGIEQFLVVAAKRAFKNDLNAQNAFVQRAISHLSYSWKLDEAVRNADLVIEAITENLTAKQDLFVNIERVSLNVESYQQTKTSKEVLF